MNLKFFSGLMSSDIPASQVVDILKAKAFIEKRELPSTLLPWDGEPAGLLVTRLYVAIASTFEKFDAARARIEVEVGRSWPLGEDVTAALMDSCVHLARAEARVYLNDALGLKNTCELLAEELTRRGSILDELATQLDHPDWWNDLSPEWENLPASLENLKSSLWSTSENYRKLFHALNQRDEILDEIRAQLPESIDVERDEIPDAIKCFITDRIEPAAILNRLTELLQVGMGRPGLGWVDLEWAVNQLLQQAAELARLEAENHTLNSRLKQFVPTEDEARAMRELSVSLRELRRWREKGIGPIPPYENLNEWVAWAEVNDSERS